MRVPKSLLAAAMVASGVWRIARRRNRRRLRILMYHGVTDRPLPTWTQLPVERFAEQMEHLRRHYRVVSLDEAVEGLRCGRALPDHAVVLTFDDGFRNNLTAAYPILRTHGFPAIIYLATAFLDRDPRFGGLLWPDRLFLLLESAPEGELDLSAWGLGRFPLRGDPDRRRAREVLSAALKREDPARKNAVLEAIAAQVGEVRGDLAQALEGLSWDEARDLDAQGLVRFGAHTMHHDILTRLPPEAVEEEINNSGNEPTPPSQLPPTQNPYSAEALAEPPPGESH